MFGKKYSDNCRYNPLLRKLIIIYLVFNALIISEVFAYTNQIHLSSIPPHGDREFEITTNYQGTIAITQITSGFYCSSIEPAGSGTYPAGIYKLKITNGNDVTGTAYIKLEYSFDDKDPVCELTVPQGWQTGSFTISWAAGDDGTDNTGLATVELKRQDANGVWVTLLTRNYDFKSVYNTNESIEQSLNASGTYKYRIDVIDHVGRQSTTTQEVKVDLMAPAIVVNNPVSEETRTPSQTISINGNISEEINGSGIGVVKVNDLVIKNISSFPNNYAFSCDCALNPGNNIITVTANDGAGHQTSKTIHVLYDPPRFVNPRINGEIHALGDQIVFSFGVNWEADVRITLLICGGEYVIKDWLNGEWDGLRAMSDGTDDYAAYIDGTIMKGDIAELIEANCGPVYLKAELTELYGNKGQYVSEALVVNIPRKSFVCSAKVTQNFNPSNVIYIPRVEFSFIKEDQPLAGVVVRYSTLKDNIPTKGIYRVVASKIGYKTRDEFYNINTENQNSIDVDNFCPFVPNEPGYLDSVHSDNDQIPDGWEYYYWNNWSGWSSESGCDLSADDGDKDPDLLTSNPSRRTRRGDGLTNLEEYRLQRLGFTVNPRLVDLIVEFDYITCDAIGKTFQPDTVTLGIIEEVMTNAGVEVHWASARTNAINIPIEDVRKQNVTASELYSYLSCNIHEYGDSNTSFDIDVVHALFGPGWTKITGPGISKSGVGGLYLPPPQNPPASNEDMKKAGVFVFDLNSRNLASGEPIQLPPNPILFKYEAYILCHELGHVLGLEDLLIP